MIYLIFTQEGFAEAKSDILQDKADLWINVDLLSPEQLAELSTNGISIYFLPDHINPNNEKAILTALDYVEQQSPKKEIFVEYP
jgi:hypothetical protein